MTAYTFSQLIDFTRVSTGANVSAGTFVNSSGLIQLSPTSTNLLLWTQEFDNATWVKTSTTVAANSVAAPDGTMTADTLTASGANGTTLQTYTATAVPYVYSVWLRRLTGTGNVDITVDGTTYSTVAVTTTWTRFSATLTPAAGSRTAGVRIVTSGDAVYAWGAQLELGSTATTYTRNVGGRFPARFDFDPITLVSRGILIEEGRANLFLQSEAFDNASWTKSGGTTVTANSTVAPDGTTTADTLTAATTASFVSQNVTFTGDGSKSYSVFLKAGTATVTRLVLRDTTAAVNRGGVNVTWTAGVPSAVATEGTLEGVDAYPSGWYRIRIVATGVVAANTNQFRFSPDTAVGTNNSIFWGAQTENGAFATSYIPTTTAALTRNTDQPSIVAPMFAPWFNTPAGTFVLTYRQLASTSAQIKAVAIVSDGTSSNRVYTYVGSAPAGAPTLLVTSAGAAQVTSTNAVITSNTSVKTASTYSANDFAIVTNGGTVATDTSGTVPTGITSLGIGVLVTGGSPLNGHIARLDYYPSRLTNAQLQALSV